MFTELLAESEFPAQGVLFLIVMVFSFLKWLFGKLTTKKEDGDSETLESLYDHYREEIIQRQTQVTQPPIKPVSAIAPSIATAPPALSQTDAGFKPQYSSLDIEKARIAKLKKSQQISSSKATTVVHSTSDSTPLSKKLRTKDGLRQAIIARQILGPPKALSGQTY